MSDPVFEAVSKAKRQEESGNPKAAAETLGLDVEVKPLPEGEKPAEPVAEEAPAEEEAPVEE